MSISEITGMESSVVQLQDIFIFKKAGRDDDGNVLGEFRATGIRPRCTETLTAAGIEMPLETFTNGDA
jgi:pilus assembly protein CpaF